ncbi:hypothetical protein Emed_001707 [Eimeria media]
MGSHGGAVAVQEPTYRMSPSEDEKFYPTRVEEVLKSVCTDFFEDKKTYDPALVEEWTHALSSKVLAAVRQTQHVPRYKLIVQVVVAQKLGQGLKVTSKSLADVNLDSWASFVYSTENLVCCAMVFGFYHE